MCAKERRICFGHLGVITLSEGQDPGSDKISILVAVSIENRFNVKNDNKHFASQILWVKTCKKSFYLSSIKPVANNHLSLTDY